MQMNLFEQKPEQTVTDYPVVTGFGPFGIKWRGRDIQKPDSSFKGDHVAQFGFSCAGCGASGVNQDPLNHEDNCDSKSPYIERN